MQRVGDANDLKILSRAIETAHKETERPSLIIVDSHIAYGSPHKQDTSGAHGAPLGKDEIRLTKERYGWPSDSQFLVPEEVAQHMNQAIQRGKHLEEEWTQQFKAYAQSYSTTWLPNGRPCKRVSCPKAGTRTFPSFLADSKGMAGRAASGKVLNAVAKKIPWLVGGSADLSPSTKTRLEEEGDFLKDQYGGRNLHFGVREHAMGAVVNGMALCKIRPFDSQFLIFSDYERPAIRLSALMGLPVIPYFHA